MNLKRLREESYTLRRVARRAGWRPAASRSEPPQRPVGAKLELLHACNLRCAFCYTDSPRHTVARTADLSDDEWRAVAEQAIELGVVETVLTGGEPLMRADLLLELVERFDAAGVGVSMNTNGWFLDERVADRLACTPNLHVHVSIDGATPELHDDSRGVPGSWDRAIRAVDRLLAREVQVHVAHVITPESEPAFPDFLEQMWTLGVRSVRATPVVPSGAAARGGDWTVDRAALGRAVAAFRARRGAEMRVALREGTAVNLATRAQAPRAMLVRPSGAVRIDSLEPFAFGDAREDGLEECWRRIVAGWRAPEIEEWARSIPRTSAIPDAQVVAYLDDDPRIDVPRSDGDDGGRARRSPLRRSRRNPEARRRTQAQRLPKRVQSEPAAEAPAGDLPGARRLVSELALSRRYRLGRVRYAPSPDERYVRRLDDGEICRLNASAGVVMDVLADGTPADAAFALAARHPGVERERLERDALDLTRWLAARRAVVPAARDALTPRA